MEDPPQGSKSAPASTRRSRQKQTPYVPSHVLEQINRRIARYKTWSQSYSKRMHLKRSRKWLAAPPESRPISQAIRDNHLGGDDVLCVLALRSQQLWVLLREIQIEGLSSRELLPIIGRLNEFGDEVKRIELRDSCPCRGHKAMRRRCERRRVAFLDASA